MVRALGAVQAQDYQGGLWGIAVRTKGATVGEVEAALARREIVRSWPLRGTLHVVLAEQLRPLLAHLAPRVIQRSATRRRQLGLDDAVLVRARRVVTSALVGGVQATRRELFATLEHEGIATSDQRGIHVLAFLALEGTICFGPHAAKQPTFVLLDEWLPSRATPVARDDTLATLARQYLSGHAPATVADFAWWAGLTRREADAAVAAAGVTRSRPARVGPSVHLLPPWDEYTVGYTDRAAVVPAALASRTLAGLAAVVLIDGVVAGTWKRSVAAREVMIAVDLEQRCSARHERLLGDAAERYGRYVGRPARLQLTVRRRRA